MAELGFSDPRSRYPFNDALDPLLNWFERAQKQKGRKLSEEEGRNSCLVPGEIRLKQRSSKKNADEETHASSPKVENPKDQLDSSASRYLMRLFTMQVEAGRVEGTCLIVFADGSYHRVRQSERSRSKQIKTAVMDGTLPNTALNFLRMILDNAEFQGFASPAIDRLIGEGLMTNLTVPRNGKAQQLVVWKPFNNYSWYKAQTTKANLEGAKLLRPLTDWVKAELPRGQERDAMNPPNPKCLPAP